VTFLLSFQSFKVLIALLNSWLNPAKIFRAAKPLNVRAGMPKEFGTVFLRIIVNACLQAKVKQALPIVGAAQVQHGFHEPRMQAKCKLGNHFHLVGHVSVELHQNREQHGGRLALTQWLEVDAGGQGAIRNAGVANVAAVGFVAAAGRLTLNQRPDSSWTFTSTWAGASANVIFRPICCPRTANSTGMETQFPAWSAR